MWEFTTRFRDWLVVFATARSGKAFVRQGTRVVGTKKEGAIFSRPHSILIISA
jgi:hypothetical protein